MTRRTELLALAERVEKGGTGYALSDACWSAFGWRNDGRYWRRPADGLIEAVIMPDLTYSIDAQAAMPGYVHHLIRVTGKDDLVHWVATAGASTGTARTEPAARLAALLRAMAEDAE